MLPNGTRHLPVVLPKLPPLQRVLPCVWPCAPNLAALARQMEAAIPGCARQRKLTQPWPPRRAAPGIVTIQTSPVLLLVPAAGNPAGNCAFRTAPPVRASPFRCDVPRPPTATRIVLANNQNKIAGSTTTARRLRDATLAAAHPARAAQAPPAAPNRAAASTRLVQDVANPGVPRAPAPVCTASSGSDIRATASRMFSR